MPLPAAAVPSQRANIPDVVSTMTWAYPLEPLTMEGRLRQPPLSPPVMPFAGDQAISQQAPQQAIVPAARIVFLVVVEHAPNVVRVIEEVDERGPMRERNTSPNRSRARS